MRITILGSGTSTGIPEYLCNCGTCRDARRPGSRNRRTRPSIHVEINGTFMQFDTGPNFLDQIDRYQVEQIDAVIYTHCHADHISGTNDLVMPCRKQQIDMPIYACAATMAVLQKNFEYMFSRETYQGGGIAHLIPHVVDTAFEVDGIEVLPLPVKHGVVPTHGYRIDGLGYVPDVKEMTAEALERLQGVEVLIIDGLSFNPQHPTHQSVGQALETAALLSPRTTYLTHIMHRLDHRYFPDQCIAQGIDLPANVHLAYDGQVIRIN